MVIHPTGRPRQVELTKDEKMHIQREYLRTNLNAGGGSMTMAARLVGGIHDDIGDTLAGRASKHSLPQAIVTACREVKAMTGLHRQGERGLRATGVYTPGKLRMHWAEDRRLWAGERFSWDDATVNFGVCVPWAMGGDKCSDRYGVRLGRFQLLLGHDDASSYVPGFSYVVRYSQAYRAVDTAGALLRMMRDAVVPDRLMLEGGVWQGTRMEAIWKAFGICIDDAKGRPNCKLVENYFQRLWTRLSVEPGQVGRYRGEMREEGRRYQAALDGREDPRLSFPMLADALQAIGKSVSWLNAEPVESREYGKWVPIERWEADLAEHPRQKLSGDWLWMAAPERAERKVFRGMVKVTADGPDGVPVRWHFSASDLYKLEGQEVELYFDPLTPAPVECVIAQGGKRLCTAVSIDRHSGQSDDEIAATVAKARAHVRREYRAIMPRNGRSVVTVSESEVRRPGLVSTISTGVERPPETEKPAPIRKERVKVEDFAALSGEKPVTTPRQSTRPLGLSLTEFSHAIHYDNDHKTNEQW